MARISRRVDLFSGLLQHTDVMTKWRRKSLFCEGVRDFVPHLARLKMPRWHFSTGC